MEVVRGDAGILPGQANAGAVLRAPGAALSRAQAAGAEARGEEFALAPPGGRVQAKVAGAVQPFHSKSLPRNTRRVFSSRTTSAGVPLLRMRPLWMI